MKGKPVRAVFFSRNHTLPPSSWGYSATSPFVGKMLFPDSVGFCGGCQPSPLRNTQLLTREQRAKNVSIIVLTPGQITGPRNRYVIQDRLESFPGICKQEKKEDLFFLPLSGKL